MATKDAKKLLEQLRERYKRCTDDSAEMENRRLAVEDLKFVNVPGNQWDITTKTERGLDRPMYEYNKLRITVKRIVNDMRSNRPQGKVRGVEDNDVDTAEIMEGLCRNIWNVSDGDTVIDYAAEYQVTCGMGAWRIDTEYSTDEAFDQDIVVRNIKNPFSLYADPSCQDPMKRDAMFWLMTTKMQKDKYKAKYPNSKPVSFQDDYDFDREADWEDDEYVRICEYWWKEPKNKTIALLSTGETIDIKETTPPAGVEIVKQRDVVSYQIKTAICSGDAILEGPTDWAGSLFPFVIVYGDYIVIDGKVHWFGLTRFAKDAQRAYNYARTAITETIALSPQAKWWATAEQAKGHTEMWAEAHKKNLPFMLFNADPKQNGAPQRMGGPDVPAALIQESQIASDEIKAVTGIFDNSLGNQANETSGVAIRARANQGQIATFNYVDNQSKGIRLTWDILIDLIPKIYDTTRSVRILGADGAEKFMKVNHVDPATGQIINDLSRGKYDTTVTVGPSFSTQRQEAVESYTQIGQTNPVLWQAAGDLMFKAMDLPYSEQIAERMKAMLPPPIQQMLQQDGKQDPQVQAAMAQVNTMMQQVQQHGQLVQKAAEEAQQEQNQAEKLKSDIQVQIANLKTQQANLAADEAKFQALVAQAKADAAIQQSTQGMETERQNLSSQVDQAFAEIQQRVAQFMSDSQNTLLSLQQNQPPPQVVVHAPPHPRVKEIKRVNGSMVPIYEDQPQQPSQPPNGMMQ